MKMDLTQTQKKEEARTDNLGGLQKHCPSMQGQGKEHKVHQELCLARDVKGNKKGFCR